MKTRKPAFSITIWIIVLFLILIGQQTKTQQPLTRAGDGPGFGVLEQARQLEVEGRFKEGYEKALEAARIFRQEANWISWGESYDKAFHCARQSTPNLLSAALVQLEEARAICADKKDMPDKSKIIIWQRIGNIYHEFGDYEEAQSAYERALPFSEQLNDTSKQIQLYANNGIVVWFLGDDYRSLNYLEKSLMLAKAKGVATVIPSILINLGNTWRTIDIAKSIPIYQEALNLDPNNSQALFLLSKGYLEGDHNIQKAITAAKSSLKYAKKDEEKADALHQLGRIHHEMKKYDQATSFYDQAYKYALTSYGEKHPECAKILYFKGRSLLEAKHFEKALTEFNQTLDDLLPLFSPASPDDNPKESELTKTSLWIAQALVAKSETYQALFNKNHNQEDLKRSLECSEKAIFYQNKIKLTYKNDESKFSLNRYYNTSCEAALQSALRLYQLTGSPIYAQKAFSLSEQTKAVVLAEALYKKDMKQVASVPAELLERERASYEQIAGFEKKLESGDSVIIAATKDSLFQARRQLEIQEQEIEKNYPAYADALYSYRTEVSADDVRKNLPADAALVEYFLGDSAIYTFLLSKDTFWVQEQTIPAAFNTSASGLLRTVNDWRWVADSSTTASSMFLESSHRLYQWLLEKPLAISKAKRLFIVPDGKLSLLPFELLLTNTYSGQWIDRNVPFLINDRAVSYRFSARQMTQKKSKPQKGWGGFGLEYNDGSLGMINTENKAQGLRDFGPLPFAGEEIKAIKTVMGGAFWLNDDATRENFLKNAGDYGVLHLAMHGMVDENNALHSRLLFSSSVAGSDPYVYASDLYNLQLEAGLSVLSACQSGTGTWKKGEGIMSLARAFAFAGCPSMIMSLWNVSDQSTSALMVSFYEQLKAGATKDEALRSAKLAYLKKVPSEYAKPIYWASFVPIGEMDSLPESYFTDGNGSFKLLFFTAMMILLATLFFAARRWFLKRSVD